METTATAIFDTTETKINFDLEKGKHYNKVNINQRNSPSNKFGSSFNTSRKYRRRTSNFLGVNLDDAQIKTCKIPNHNLNSVDLTCFSFTTSGAGISMLITTDAESKKFG